MNIALVCDWFLPRLGGMERHLVQLAEQLAAAGHNVTVITPTKGPSATPQGVRLQRLPACLLPGVGLLWTPTSFRRLGAVLRAGGFDLVHVHSSLISPAAYAALYHAQKAGLPTACTWHSILGGFAPSFALLDRAVHWTRWPIAFSGVSDRVARELRPLVAPQPVDVLPNAVDPAEWRLPNNAPSGVIAIACVMRLVSRKRGPALLHAVRTACSHLPAGYRLLLQLAGDGPERPRLERLARRLGLSHQVRFLGALTTPRVKTLLAASHFFVLPSKLEAFGIAALEARAAGLPVVAMRESGVAEFIIDGEDGLLADNDEQFAQHLLRLCTDAELRAALTRHNREVPVTFTWERTLAAHYVTYDRARRLCAQHAAVQPRNLGTYGLAAQPEQRPHKP